MKLQGLPLVLLLFPLLAACGSPPSISARATATLGPTPTATPEPGTFYFTTEDGVTLNGQIYGQGKTAVVFSNQVDGDRTLWDALVQQLVGRSYLVMTYDYRGVDHSQGRDEPELTDRDLRAAIGVVRTHGATSIALVGASLGGLVTAKVAAMQKPAAVVILSAPGGFGSLGISDAELRTITAPKLFMVSQDDRQFVGDVQHMFDTTPQPKQLHIYPGNGHGVSILLNVSTGADATQRLVSFLEANAPAS